MRTRWALSFLLCLFPLDLRVQHPLLLIPFHPPTQLVDSLWEYDLKCSKVTPLPHHTQKDVTWMLMNLTELDPNHLLVGLWRSDTVFLDTALVFNYVPMATYRSQIMGHELMHQLFHSRVPVDSSIPARLREVQDSSHPLPYFGIYCHYRSVEPLLK